MTPVLISLIAFLCVFGATLFGMYLRRVLPEHHLNAESRSTVNLAIGLIGTVSGIALGLLVAFAAGKYDTQKNELTEMSAKFALLDRALAHYGPEAKESRDQLRKTVVRTLDRIWPESRSEHSQLDPTGTGGEDLYDTIQQLSPQNDEQRAIKAQALSLLVGIGQTRWMMYEQGGVPFPKPFLVVVVFWLTIVFISFGLHAPCNSTVVVVLLVSALSVAGAIFLILELYDPFEGWLQISSAPLRNALAQFGK
ncbi:MAG: hypothetical protein C5B56_15310 [Proteobacteria bacterium]|nr:MAG: hypothetical protein C5B56_15310 [Pseudomonadota bacterium]